VTETLARCHLLQAFHRAAVRASRRFTTSRGSWLLVHGIKLGTSVLGGRAGWQAVGPSSRPSSERAAVTPLAPPSGRRHLRRHDGKSEPKRLRVDRMRMDPTLPSSVRHPATHGSVFDSTTCGVRWRRSFNVASRPRSVG
jgi:hypothetical protein